MLAKKIPSVDSYLIANIVNAFEGSMNQATGELLVSALMKSKDKLVNISEQDLAKGVEVFFGISKEICRTINCMQ